MSMSKRCVRGLGKMLVSLFIGFLQRYIARDAIVILQRKLFSKRDRAMAILSRTSKI